MFMEERSACTTTPGLTGFPVDVTFTRVLAAKELRHIELQLGGGAQGSALAPMEGTAGQRLSPLIATAAVASHSRVSCQASEGLFRCRHQVQLALHTLSNHTAAVHHTLS